MTEKQLFSNKSKSKSDTKKYLNGRWWTSDGDELYSKIKNVLNPIIQEYVFKDFNIREIHYIIDFVASDIILDLCLDDKGEEI